MKKSFCLLLLLTLLLAGNITFFHFMESGKPHTEADDILICCDLGRTY